MNPSNFAEAQGKKKKEIKKIACPPKERVKGGKAKKRVKGDKDGEDGNGKNIFLEPLENIL